MLGNKNKTALCTVIYRPSPHPKDIIPRTLDEVNEVRLIRVGAMELCLAVKANEVDQRPERLEPLAA